MDPSLFTTNTPVNQHALVPIPAPAPADMQSAAGPGTQKKGSTTRARKTNRTPAQIITDEACAAQKLAEKTALRANRTAAAKRKKDDRAALAQLRLAERAEQATRLKWTEEVLLELVAFVRMVKDDHNDLEEGMMGYTAFGKFLNYNNKRVGEFALLAGVENSFLLTQYRSLMGTWRQVKDYTDVSGSGGLFGALVKFGLSLSLWNTMLDMNGDNPEAIDHGQGDIKDNMDNLYDDSMSDGLVAESNGYLLVRYT
ncbi:hypothetical protein KEM48_014187 [Puccinia striiformis f. sp. tritici PST-130]|nr:hypothetical protein KEM48_014187 [Puccinia striiformis f. sp. tritici PST-130]